MQNANKPDPSELPTTRQLLKSTGIAVAVASALLVVVVLPAEYGVDPTRAGSLFGLTEMGRIKVQLAAEAKAEVPASPVQAVSETVVAAPAETPAAPAAAVTGRTDQTVFTLAPDGGVEVKLTMIDGATAGFVWFTDGERVNFDTHGDGRGIAYHGYGKGTDSRVEGQLTAAFTGKHGWFWRNRSGKTVQITLQTRGAYTAIETVD